MRVRVPFENVEVGQYFSLVNVGSAWDIKIEPRKSDTVVSGFVNAVSENGIHSHVPTWMNVWVETPKRMVE